MTDHLRTNNTVYHIMLRGAQAKYGFAPPTSMKFSSVCLLYSEEDICLPRREDYSADYFLQRKKKSSRSLEKFTSFLKGETKCKKGTQ